MGEQESRLHGQLLGDPFFDAFPGAVGGIQGRQGNRRAKSPLGIAALRLQNLPELVDNRTAMGFQGIANNREGDGIRFEHSRLQFVHVPWIDRQKCQARMQLPFAWRARVGQHVFQMGIDPLAIIGQLIDDRRRLGDVGVQEAVNQLIGTCCGAFRRGLLAHEKCGHREQKDGDAQPRKAGEVLARRRPHHLALRVGPRALDGQHADGEPFD